MKRITAALLASTFAASAYAADAIVYQDPVPAASIVAPVFDWTGAYIGGQIGYGAIDIDPDGFVDPGGVFVPGGEPGADGFFGGVHAGYNYDLGNVVLGGEIDYDFIFRDLDDVTDGELQGIGRARLKAGWDMGRVLPYVTGGLGYAMAEVGDDSLSGVGYVVGAGIYFAATDNIIVGADYLYHRFDNFDDTTVDIDGHAVRARVSYKF